MKNKIISLPERSSKITSAYYRICKQTKYISLGISLLLALVIYQKISTKYKTTIKYHMDPRIEFKIGLSKIKDSKEGVSGKYNPVEAHAYTRDLMYPYIYELSLLSHNIENKIFPYKDFERFKTKLEKIIILFNGLDSIIKDVKEAQIVEMPDVLREEFYKNVDMLTLIVENGKDLIKTDQEHQKIFTEQHSKRPIAFVSKETLLLIKKTLHEIIKKNNDFILQLNEDFNWQEAKKIATYRETISTDKIFLNEGWMTKVLEEKKFYTPQIGKYMTIAEQTSIRINEIISYAISLIFFSLSTIGITCFVLFRGLQQQNNKLFNEIIALQAQIDKTKTDINRLIELEEKSEKEKSDKKNKLKIQKDISEKVINKIEKVDTDIQQKQKNLEELLNKLKIHNELHPKIVIKKSEILLKLDNKKRKIDEIIRPIADIFKDQQTVYITEKEMHKQTSKNNLLSFFQLLRKNDVNNIKLILSSPDTYTKEQQIIKSFKSIIEKLRKEPKLEILITNIKLHNRVIESEKEFVNLGISIGQIYSVKSALCKVTNFTKVDKGNKGFQIKSNYLREVLKQTKPLNEWEKTRTLA